MIEIKLKAKEERRLLAGHYWVFSNEIDGLDTSIEPGTLVRVLAHDGTQAGIGCFNPHSLIAVRLLKKGEGDLPEDFGYGLYLPPGTRPAQVRPYVLWRGGQYARFGD